MGKENQKNNNLRPAEQKTTAAFKLLSEQIKTLKLSLKKTQDSLEQSRTEKSEVEKRNSILEYKQRSIFWIEIFKFLSSAGIGFAANYLVIADFNTALFYGVPSIIIFSVTIIFSNK